MAVVVLLVAEVEEPAGGEDVDWVGTMVDVMRMVATEVVWTLPVPDAKPTDVDREVITVTGLFEGAVVAAAVEFCARNKGE